MGEFTEQERHIIDDIHKRNFENLTSDEVRLLMRWTAYNAALEAESSERVRIRRENAEKRAAARREQAALAKQNLKELKEIAINRMREIDGTQTE